MTDAELVARLKANDDEAYREVVARFSDPLYGYIYSISGDHHLSEDVLGETYLRMVEKIDTYTFYRAPFKAWLYRSAHNLAINALERAHHLVGADVLETAAPPVDDPATTIAVRLEADELRAALTELTDEQQQVVLLRFVAEQSTAADARHFTPCDCSTFARRGTTFACRRPNQYTNAASASRCAAARAAAEAGR